jgi:hypothetical protein
MSEHDRVILSRAWMLDAVEFHRELDQLLDASPGPDGLLRLRHRAVEIWHSKDPIVHAYVDSLPTAGADDWESSFEEAHLVEWYRVVMAPYLIPTRAYRAPHVLKRRLPDLGWTPADARRLALGRELQLLVEAYGSPALLDAVRPHLTLGNKGWLAQEDVELALRRLRALDRELFRGRSELVPLVENAYEVLEAAATKPDHVLVMVSNWA